MSAGYKPVQWSVYKLGYDVVVLGLVALYVAAFERWGAGGADAIVVRMRAWGSCALLLLTVILSLGPLARLDRRFLPLVFNRRHAGVILFFVAARHAWLVLGHYHGYSDVPEVESLLTFDTAFTAASVPFQLLGAAALAWLALMAATSHDFWLHNLGARAWKAIHMGVYGVFALVALHVAFGELQLDHGLVNAGLLGLAIAWVGGLHVAAAWRSTRLEREARAPVEGWLDAGDLASLGDGGVRAVVGSTGERIAVMRHAGGISATHGVCRHQGGPLGEGRVIDGCLTCPWHGWQYRPDDGCAPPPFTEKIPTHRVRVVGGRVLVDPTPLPAGTRVEPAPAEPVASEPGSLFVGWAGLGRERLPFVGAAVVLLVGLFAGTAFAVATNQAPPGDGSVGGSRSYTGLVVPSPGLLVADDGAGGVVHVLLAATGKFGVQAKLAPQAGTVATLKGLALDRDGHTLLEVRGVAPASVDPEVEARLRAAVPEDVGDVVLRGEIVDSKCYYGRMRPGGGRTHRACAQLCVRGGVPAVLVTHDEAGNEAHYVLAGDDGRDVRDEVLPFVAEPVEVRGRLSRSGDLRWLALGTGAVTRLFPPTSR